MGKQVCVVYLLVQVLEHESFKKAVQHGTLGACTGENHTITTHGFGDGVSEEVGGGEGAGDVEVDTHRHELLARAACRGGHAGCQACVVVVMMVMVMV